MYRSYPVHLGYFPVLYSMWLCLSHVGHEMDWIDKIFAPIYNLIEYRGFTFNNIFSLTILFYLGLNLNTLKASSQTNVDDTIHAHLWRGQEKNITRRLTQFSLFPEIKYFQTRMRAAITLGAFLTAIFPHDSNALAVRRDIAYDWGNIEFGRAATAEDELTDSEV